MGTSSDFLGNRNDDPSPQSGSSVAADSDNNNQGEERINGAADNNEEKTGGADLLDADVAGDDAAEEAEGTNKKTEEGGATVQEEVAVEGGKAMESFAKKDTDGSSDENSAAPAPTVVEKTDPAKEEEKDAQTRVVASSQKDLTGNSSGNQVDGDGDELPEEYLDLVQILAILLIPTLARAAQKFQVEEERAPEMVDDDDDELHQSETVESNSEQEKSEEPDNGDEVYKSLEPQPASLIEDGLKYLLKNVFIDSEDTLDVDLVEALLLEVGEYERAQNTALLEEMVEAARTASGRLDAAALAQALTADLTEWEVGSEDRLSTYAEDVFGGEHGPPPPAEEEEEENTDKKVKSRAFEMSSIDYVVDTHTSVVLVGIIWTFYFMVG